MPRPDPSGGVYLPRRAEETPLYGVVSGHLETFLQRVRERGRAVPRFVEREFRGFLDCGIPAHGFMRVRCDACRLECASTRSRPQTTPRWPGSFDAAPAPWRARWPAAA
jgi:hypothetical protein